MNSPFNEQRYIELLEGLEISEIRLSEVKNKTYDFRIEAEHYQRKYKEMKQVLLRHKCTELSNLVAKPIQTGHTPSMKDESFYGGNIKFIKTDNLRNNEIKAPFTNYLSEKGNDEIKRTSLEEDDIITTIIGATYDVIARSCIIRKELLPANINQNIARIQPDKSKINPEYLNIYLNTKYGKMYLEYLSRQMEQVNLNCEEVGNVKIPMFSPDFQKTIAKTVRTAHDYLHKSKVAYSCAESLFYDELGLTNWQPSNNQTNIKSFKDSFLLGGRLDAEYYQTKYDDLLTHLSKYDYDTLGEIVNINKSIEPGSEAYQDFGIPFVRVSDISMFGITPPDIFLSPYDYDVRALQPKKDTVLLSKDGTVGIAYKVDKDMDCITSSALLHLNIFNSDYNPDYLTLVLNSIVVQMQASRDAGGSIIQHWKQSEIEKVIIPKLQQPIQEAIAVKIQESFRLRNESKHLLEEAKNMVENEIEAPNV